MRLDARTELVIAADIAARLGISRARVSVLASRSDFPRPVGRLGRSDVGIVLLRQLWERELRALAAGLPLKQWARPPALVPSFTPAPA